MVGCPVAAGDRDGSAVGCGSGRVEDQVEVVGLGCPGQCVEEGLVRGPAVDGRPLCADGAVPAAGGGVARLAVGGDEACAVEACEYGYDWRGPGVRAGAPVGGVVAEGAFQPVGGEVAEVGHGAGGGPAGPVRAVGGPGQSDFHGAVPSIDAGGRIRCRRGS